MTHQGTAYFSFLPTGPGPLSYQWLSNDVPISGATGDVLAITSFVLPVNLVSNGSFETPVVGGTYVTHTAGQNIEAGRSRATQFTWWRALWTASDGTQSMDLSSNPGGAIYQDVPTVPGQQYFLHFALSGDPEVISRPENQPGVVERRPAGHGGFQHYRSYHHGHGLDQLTNML